MRRLVFAAGYCVACLAAVWRHWQLVVGASVFDDVIAAIVSLMMSCDCKRCNAMSQHTMLCVVLIIVCIHDGVLATAAEPPVASQVLAICVGWFAAACYIIPANIRPLVRKVVRGGWTSSGSWSTCPTVRNATCLNSLVTGR